MVRGDEKLEMLTRAADGTFYVTTKLCHLLLVPHNRVPSPTIPGDDDDVPDCRHRAGLCSSWHSL